MKKNKGSYHLEYALGPRIKMIAKLPIRTFGKERTDMIEDRSGSKTKYRGFN